MAGVLSAGGAVTIDGTKPAPDNGLIFNEQNSSN
jgi:hypothetical protein